MAQRPLSGIEITALVHEVDAIARLISHGIDILRFSPYTRGTAPVVFACLGIGAERLLKLTFGLMERDENGSWPSPAAMKTTHSHKIYELDTECRRRLLERAQLGSDPARITALLQQVDEDTIIKVLLGALQRETAQGKFYNLDILAGAPQQRLSAVDGWVRFENVVAKSDESIAQDLSSDDHQERGQRRLNEKIAVSVERWRTLYFESWATAVVGTEAALFYPHMSMAWDHAASHPLLNRPQEADI